MQIGGVAIFVRSYLGLGTPPAGPAVLVEGRVVSGIVNTPGTNGFVAYAGYLHDAEGLSERNLGILQEIGMHVSGHGRPFICGADFNMDPRVLASTDFVSKLSAQIIHSDLRVGT